MIRNRVLKYLADVCMKKLKTELDNLKIINQQKLRKLSDNADKPYRVKLLTGKEDIVNTRIDDLQFVYNKLYNMKFEVCEDRLLVETGAFCDRQTMFYDNKIIEYTDESLAQVVLCALFNSMQNYFTLIKLTDSRKIITRHISQLMMYHIGMIEEKLWYGQQYANNYEKLYNKYPDFDMKYKTFMPTQAQSNHMIHKAVFDNKNNVYGEVIADFSTTEAKQITIKIEYYDIVLTGLKKVTSRLTVATTVYMIINEDGTYTRISGIRKELRSHKETVAVTKELMK